VERPTNDDGVLESLSNQHKLSTTQETAIHTYDMCMNYTMRSQLSIYYEIGKYNFLIQKSTVVLMVSNTVWILRRPNKIHFIAVEYNDESPVVEPPPENNEPPVLESLHEVNQSPLVEIPAVSATISRTRGNGRGSGRGKRQERA